jgi:hypothetical protein
VHHLRGSAHAGSEIEDQRIGVRHGFHGADGRLFLHDQGHEEIDLNEADVAGEDLGVVDALSSLEDPAIASLSRSDHHRPGAVTTGCTDLAFRIRLPGRCPSRFPDDDPPGAARGPVHRRQLLAEHDAKMTIAAQALEIFGQLSGERIRFETVVRAGGESRT